MPHPCDLTVTAAAAAIAAGEITSEELVRACLERIDELEPRLQAWAYIDREHALAQAREADEERKSGKGVGRLHGVPIGIKDIIDTADMPTENGCKAFKGRQPDADAACISSLRAAGAVIMGKTVTTELATRTPGPTRNPRNPEHTPGGSSSGSAAAVASGMVPAALGTQTIGSVIRPSAFCGLYGYKPTFGMIPRPGVLNQSHTLDTVGVLGRSIEDVALVADVMQGYDDRDRHSISASRPRLVEIATQEWPLPPLFAFVRTHAWNDADPATREAFGELVDLLGGQVEEISIEHAFERGSMAGRLIQKVELATNFGPLLDKSPELISKILTDQIEEGRRTRAVDYMAALNAREALYAIVRELFLTRGTILTPAALGPAPKGLSTTGDPVFCGFWTYLGTPAVTLPLREAEGLPMGVQLVGPRRDDGRLLRSAKWLVRHVESEEA
jgi:Asp-tRNA(Asn)/Glu-tRNA(Gln) amidotransferase A subunit family amidase